MAGAWREQADVHCDRCVVCLRGHSIVVEASDQEARVEWKQGNSKGQWKRSKFTLKIIGCVCEAHVYNNTG